ncbi:MAG: hypothetical protein ACKVHE_23225, partial [Planctomycetales bacterium]
TEQNLTLAQVATDVKSNKITAIPRVLELADELSDLLRAHALGELADRDLVKQALDRLRGNTKPEVQELREEFKEVYVQNDPRSKRSSDEWQDKGLPT